MGVLPQISMFPLHATPHVGCACAKGGAGENGLHFYQIYTAYIDGGKDGTMDINEGQKIKVCYKVHINIICLQVLNLHENQRCMSFTNQINDKCIINFKQLLAKNLTVQTLNIMCCVSPI